MKGRAGLILLWPLLTASCMQYVVQPPAPSIAGNPQEVQVSSYLGGTVQQPPYVLAEACVDGEQLARVQVRRNVAQGLVNWITLGMVAPTTVIYECSNMPRPGSGILDDEWSSRGEG